MRCIFFISLLFICNAVLSRTIIVGKDLPVKSIKQAVGLAKNNDTIKVMPGNYAEGTITITKPLVLSGISFPVLDGENKFEILVIQASDVYVNGFVFKNSLHSSSNDYAAVSIMNASKVYIENNTILNANFGIHVANSNYCTIKNNRITGEAVSEQSAGNGIHIWKSNHINVESNYITGHRDGIYFEFVYDSEIKNNISEKNIRYGLHFMFSDKDNYINNIFSNNGTGVAVMYTKNVRMEGNTFEKNWGSASYGILLKDITDSYMLNNKFTDNTIGIFMEGGNRIDIKKNIFKNNGWAMKVQANCMDNNINYNDFKNNTFDISTNGTLVLSNFNNNYWDKYEGYDLNRDGIGDIPYHPVSMYSMIVEENPNALMLLRSFTVQLLDKAEKAIPGLTPENLVDTKPLMKSQKL